MRRETKQTLKVNKSYEGETLQTKLRRAQTGGTGLEKITEGVYAENYMPALDIRTDRFEIALEALMKKDFLGRKEAAEALKKAADIETVKPAVTETKEVKEVATTT